MCNGDWQQRSASFAGNKNSHDMAPMPPSSAQSRVTFSFRTQTSAASVKRQRRNQFQRWLLLFGCCCAFLTLQVGFLLQEHGSVMSRIQGEGGTDHRMEESPAHDHSSSGDDVQQERSLVEHRSTTEENSLNTTAASLPSRIHESSFVYAGREYRYRYSTKRFSESKDTIPSTLLNATSEKLPNIAFGICSVESNFLKRQLIRATWGSRHRRQTFFMVAGLFDNQQRPGAAKDTMDELQAHGDLIWLDIPEDYRHALTPKTFALMNFANHHFLGRLEDGTRAVMDASGKSATAIDYIFKTDDDVFLNATEMSVELYKKGLPEFYGLNKTGTVPCRNAIATAEEGGK
ncbi:MAG: hypothetical protein SGARI_007099, partial [Bacillariaceae sp.]